MKIAPRSLLRGTHLTATPGNSGLPADELIALTEKLLELTAELVRTAIGLELTEGNIIADNVGETPCLFLASLHRAERAIAERLMRLANGTPPWPRIDLDKALPWVEKRIGLTLAESQVASKEYAHRELRRMIGGDANSDQQRTNDFSEYSDAELMAEIAKLANELQVNVTLTIEPSKDDE